MNHVSMTSRRRSENYQLTEIRHEILLGSGYERVLEHNPQKVVLEPIEPQARALCQGLPGTFCRQQLWQLLEELELKGRETEWARRIFLKPSAESST